MHPGCTPPAAEIAAVAALPTRFLAASDPAVEVKVEPYIYASAKVTPRLAYVARVRTTDTSRAGW